MLIFKCFSCIYSWLASLIFEITVFILLLSRVTRCSECGSVVVNIYSPFTSVICSRVAGRVWHPNAPISIVWESWVLLIGSNLLMITLNFTREHQVTLLESIKLTWKTKLENSWKSHYTPLKDAVAPPSPNRKHIFYWFFLFASVSFAFSNLIPCVCLEIWKNEGKRGGKSFPISSKCSSIESFESSLTCVKWIFYGFSACTHNTGSNKMEPSSSWVRAHTKKDHENEKLDLRVRRMFCCSSQKSIETPHRHTKAGKRYKTPEKDKKWGKKSFLISLFHCCSVFHSTSLSDDDSPPSHDITSS